MTASQTEHANQPAAPDPTEVGSARRHRRRRTIYASIAGWALLGAASTGIVACNSAQASETTSTATTSTASTTSSAPDPTTAASTTSGASTEAADAATTAAAAASTYQDGTYTATGTYASPGGTESVTITLTLANDVITDATAVGGATKPPSSQYQSEFVNNFAALIVGKDIDDVSLDKVAGSSLTSGGFDAAVETIKADALA